MAATTWSGVEPLYTDVREAIGRAAAEQGEPIVVYAHLSHLYRDGAAIYFSLLGRQHATDPIGQWWAIKDAAAFTPATISAGIVPPRVSQSTRTSAPASAAAFRQASENSGCALKPSK